ncbi:serine-rich adhesin for platelets-like isoform X2 [Periplaneta americana]|uniref:serine-rich adhesin for platelets-like isoform X2 n=1 Tax=Periplaneta americana TaxID=6978 RepID=UPI0037E72DAC
MQVFRRLLLFVAFQQLMTPNIFNAIAVEIPLSYASVPLQQVTLMQNDLTKTNNTYTNEGYSTTVEGSNEEDHKTTIEGSNEEDHNTKIEGSNPQQSNNAQNENKNKSLSFLNIGTRDSFVSSSPRISEFMEHFSRTQPTPTERQALERFSTPVSSENPESQVSLNSASISPAVENNASKIFLVNTSLSSESTGSSKSPKASEIQLSWEGTSRPSNSTQQVFLESLSTKTTDKKSSLESTSTTLPSEITDQQTLLVNMSRPSLPETDVSASRSSLLVTIENQTTLKSNESQVSLRNISRKLSEETTENAVTLEKVTKSNQTNTQMSENEINSAGSTSISENVTKSPQTKMLDHTASDQANDSHLDTVTFPSTFLNFTNILRSSEIDSINMTNDSTTENLSQAMIINNSDTNSRAINEIKMNITDHNLQNNFITSNSSMLHNTSVTGHSDSKVSESNETMSTDNDYLKHTSSTYRLLPNSSSYTTPIPTKSGDNISVLTAISENMLTRKPKNITNLLSDVRMQNEDIESKTTPLNFSNRATPTFNDSGYVTFLEVQTSSDTNEITTKPNISYSVTNSTPVGSIYNTFLTDIAAMNSSEDALLVMVHSTSKRASLIRDSSQTQLPEIMNTTVDPVLQTTSILPVPTNVSSTEKPLADWENFWNITSHYLMHKDSYIKTENLTELETKEDTIAITFKCDFEYAEWFLKYYPKFKSCLAKSISWNSEIQKKWGTLLLHDEILHVIPGPFKVKNSLVANIVVRNPIYTEEHKYIPGLYLLECLTADKYYIEKLMKIEILNMSVGIYIEPGKECVNAQSMNDILIIGLYVVLPFCTLSVIIALVVLNKKRRGYLVPPPKPPRTNTTEPES